MGFREHPVSPSRNFELPRGPSRTARGDDTLPALRNWQRRYLPASADTPLGAYRRDHRRQSADLLGRVLPARPIEGARGIKCALAVARAGPVSRSPAPAARPRRTVEITRELKDEPRRPRRWRTRSCVGETSGGWRRRWTDQRRPGSKRPRCAAIRRGQEDFEQPRARAAPPSWPPSSARAGHVHRRRCLLEVHPERPTWRRTGLPDKVGPAPHS